MSTEAELNGDGRVGPTMVVMLPSTSVVRIFRLWQNVHGFAIFIQLVIFVGCDSSQQH